MNPSGTYKIITTVGENVQAFVPAPLPPPELAITTETRQAIYAALLALGRLDSAMSVIPDRNLLLYFYIRKEAVLSSQIEGTQSSLADLLLHESDKTPGVPIDDTAEVLGYVRALEYGLEKLRAGFPLSNRLLREMHQHLLTGARGEHKAPGEFRRTQNWIGGSRPGNANFVPPPPELVQDCMSGLETFLHAGKGEIGIIEKAALAHVQFETIHPFLDGNGRLGRLLIALLLYHDKILQDPALYLSLYFKEHRDEYYALLDRVRLHSDWNAWIHFFAQAVGSVAARATDTARKIDELARTDRARVAGLGRKSGSALPVIEALLQRPLIQIAEIVKATGLAPNTVAATLKSLTELNITSEISGRQRDRIFAYDALMSILSEGMDSTD